MSKIVLALMLVLLNPLLDDTSMNMAFAGVELVPDHDQGMIVRSPQFLCGLASISALFPRGVCGAGAMQYGRDTLKTKTERLPSYIQFFR
ncbi:hypothetical protein [Janthinobacterium sp. PAMC25594]|uniref:hypothetical protein n=1 Tax=Janthinobacterium sp. PAMC25594 TaxID=2861284 RepID=UPI001C626F4F|nr:hypothetical protein [Janthinobacterium sp. PAMC25594]QYG08768.1 hypothetical protein KY494_08490 [Janthinobacterium sp. PAMC25594]